LGRSARIRGICWWRRCWGNLQQTAPPDAYYLSINYQQSGPFSLEQLKSMVSGGRMSKDHWIRAASGADWMPVTALPELKAFFGGSGNKSGATKPETARSKQQAATAYSTREEGEGWRELYTLTGHTGSVNSVAYSPDGRRIVAGAMADTVRIWGRE
jgi:WD40 repeat protein